MNRIAIIFLPDILKCHAYEMKYAYFEVSIVLDVKLFGDDVVTLHAGHSHRMFRDMHRRDMYLNYYLIFNIIGRQREK